jgi:hypothetical protein
MCDWCMKHGVGGKWYLNSNNYSNELARELNLEESRENVREADRSLVRPPRSNDSCRGTIGAVALVPLVLYLPSDLSVVSFQVCIPQVH